MGDVVNFAKNNPSVVVYLKPRRHRSPTLVAEFLNGERHTQSLNNFTSDQVSGYFDFFKTLYSNTPSIQGYWTPTTHKNPADTQAQFPLSLEPGNTEKSASSLLEDMYESNMSRETFPDGEEEKLARRRQGEASPPN